MSVALVAVVALAGAIRVDAPLTLTATSPTSAQETSLLPFVGVRAGVVDNAAAGLFFGADGGLHIGYESQGTTQVGTLRLPILVEGRGLVGSRYVGGLVGVGGYGFAGVGGGGGVATFQAFDASTSRAFGLVTLRAGGGGEIAFGPVLTRIEVGLGVQNLRFEVSGSFGVGGTF
jgi:hypothetical protein